MTKHLKLYCHLHRAIKMQKKEQPGKMNIEEDMDTEETTRERIEEEAEKTTMILAETITTAITGIKNVVTMEMI